jgi:hypothetical protein
MPKLISIFETLITGEIYAPFASYVHFIDCKPSPVKYLKLPIWYNCKPTIFKSSVDL